MHLCLGFACGYMILGMVVGVIAREITRRKGFDAQKAKTTNLLDLHVHTFMLGMAMFLILALFAHISDFTGSVLFRWFLCIYNIGLLGMLAMLAVRGTLELKETKPSKAVNASVSGTAGLFHVTLCAGFILLFIILLSAF
ncbi:MAG: DUF2871 family protein [Bifidobacteriaceae bacterium]|nr:DUF2871 family protein [Aeriscardovia sp.]MEE1324029.1 DUF2871 family protein [Bifidobacteriaceae bacterium]